MVGVKVSSKLSISKAGTFWLFPPGFRDGLSQYSSSHSGVDREATSRLRTSWDPLAVSLITDCQ